MPLDRLRLAADRDPWAQQPGESARRFAQFLAYRDLGPGRTVTEAAEKVTKSEGYLRNVSAANLWGVRAQAWDLHRAQIADAVWAEEGRKAAETTHRLLNLAKGKLAHSLSSLDPEKLTRSETIRLLDVIAGRHLALFGAAQSITLTGPGGGPIRIGHEPADEFEGLPLEAQAKRLIDMGRTAIRRGTALLGIDDDECECTCPCGRCRPGSGDDPEHHDQDDEDQEQRNG